MLSTENNNPDLSCSSLKISGLKNHEWGTTDTVTLEQQQQDHTDLLKSGLTDNDNNNNHHLPTFSLRDYVFTARRKGIEKSWPFPREYLDICLKHGVRDPLPPFEPPDSVRNLCRRDNSLVEVISLEKEEDNVNLDGESFHRKFKSCERYQQSILSLIDQTRTLLQEPKKLTSGPTGKGLSPGLHEIEEEIVPKVITNPLAKKERLSASRVTAYSKEVATTSSKALEEHQVPAASKKSRNTTEPTSKKCKVVEKSGVVSYHGRIEDTVSNTTISEPMASKVCPVCKTFLSTSNTTLNAHIDQCLAVGSTSSKLNVNFTLSKDKIKLVKKRLMVDIYKTAPRSTLEDLDRRNGSNWVVELKTPTPDADVCTEGKRRRLSQTYPEDIGDESAVYLDSNGRKILILSKLDEVPPPRSGEDSRAKRPTNESKEKHMGLIGKVKCVGSKDGKHMKFKSQNKMICSLKLSRTEICGIGNEKDGLNDNFEEEDSMPECPKARDNSCELRQWVCSKRTSLSTKLDGKDACRGLRYTSLARNPIVENIQSNLSHSSEEILQNHPNSENPIPTPKFDKVVAGSPKATENHLNCLNEGIPSSTHVGCTLKLSRTSKNLVSSPRSKRVEVQSVATAENSGRLPKRKTVKPSDSCNQVSPKCKLLSTTTKNVLSVEASFSKSNPYEGEKSCIWKKSRMHRSTLKTREQIKTVWSDVYGQYSRMDDSTENNRRSLDQIQGCHESSRPNKFARSAKLDMCISDVAVSQQESERKTGRKQTKVLGGLESEPKASTVSSQVGVHFSTSFFPENLNDMEFAAEEVSFSGEDATTELPPPNARSNCNQSCASEAWMVSSEQTVCDGQRELSYSRNVTDVIQRTYMAPDVDSYKVDVGNSFTENEHTECGSEQISVPGPPGFFLPSPGEDINSAVHVDSSSLTSNRLPSSQDRSVLVNGDSSGSPVSATSTISHLHTHTISDSDWADPNSVVRSSAVLEKPVNNFSPNGNSTKPLTIRDVKPFSCAPNMVNAERTNLGMLRRKDTKKSLVAESLKFSDDQSPCCCSKKERIPWDDSITYQAPQSRQHHMGSSISPSVGSQIKYNPKSRPELGFAYSSSCSSLKFNENAHPMLDSVKNSVSLRTYSDAASKFPSHDEFGFTNSSSPSHHHTQSTSNPVLRLMGKNLMVVNKEDDSSSQPKATSSYSNYSTQRGFSTGNMITTDEDFPSLYHMTSNGSVVFNKYCSYEAMNRVDVNLSESLGNLSRSSQRNSQPPAENCYVNNHHVGGLTGSFLPHLGPKDVMDHLQISNPQKSIVDRPNSHFRHNGERGTAAPQHNLNSAYVATSSNREVIVIDDSPENEDANLGREFTSESRQQSSPAAMGNPNFRQVNPLYPYQSVNPFSPREACFGTHPMLWPKGGMDNPAKPQVENSNSRGSGVGLHSSLGPVFCRPIL